MGIVLIEIGPGKTSKPYSNYQDSTCSMVAFPFLVFTLDAVRPSRRSLRRVLLMTFKINLQYVSELSILQSVSKLIFLAELPQNMEGFAEFKGEVKAKIKISPVVVFGVLSRMVLVRES